MDIIKYEEGTQVLLNKPYDISDDVYHSDKVPGVSRSFLTKLLKKANAINNFFKETDALRYGRAFHTFLLEKTKFEQKYHILDRPVDLDLRTKAGKEWMKDQKLEAGNRETVDQQDVDTFNEIESRVCGHPLVGHVLELEHKEKAYFVNIDGDMLKCKADIVDLENGIIYDIKTIRDISTQEINYSARSHYYDFQAAFYIRVFQHVYDREFTFKFIFCEKTLYSPGIRVFRVNEEMLQSGIHLMSEAIKRYNDLRAKEIDGDDYKYHQEHQAEDFITTFGSGMRY